MEIAMEMAFTRRGRIADAVAMFVVAMISLSVLVYIAFGEARRNDERFQVERLISQGRAAQVALEDFVRAGFALRQFTGFAELTDGIVDGDPLVENIEAYDAMGRRVFSSIGGGVHALLLVEGRKSDDGRAEVRASDTLLQAILPIRNRGETVGSLVLSSPRARVNASVGSAFQPLRYIVVVAAAVFALSVVLFGQNGAPGHRMRVVTAAFSIQFAIVSAFVVHALLLVYAQGGQLRTRAVADALASRLESVIAHGLPLQELAGIGALTEAYKRLNPDIRAIAVLEGERIRAHSAPVPERERWVSLPDEFEFSVPVAGPSSVVPIRIMVAMPKGVVFRQVLRSGKNFVALFVACVFIASLVMGAARSLHFSACPALEEEARGMREEEARARIGIGPVKPLFFLSVFIEYLSCAFMPQLMGDYANRDGLSLAHASVPFLAYYAAFALVLVPAGRFNDRFGPRRIILAGLALAGAGIALLEAVQGIQGAILARALAGIGQGMLFIGVQSYVLANASAQRKTRANAAIVFRFHAGMISGMVTGSLLVADIGPVGVFRLGAGIALLTLLYGFAVLPGDHQAGGAASGVTLWAGRARLLRDASFLRCMLLIGVPARAVPAKAVLTGVLLFALPLLLTGAVYSREDIGQITMIYAGCVIAASAGVFVRLESQAATGAAHRISVINVRKSN